MKIFMIKEPVFIFNKGAFYVIKNNKPITSLNKDCRKIVIYSNKLEKNTNTSRLYKCVLLMSAN